FMSTRPWEGDFTAGHELDCKWKVPKEMIGRRLSQKEAKRLLAKVLRPMGCSRQQHTIKTLPTRPTGSSCEPRRRRPQVLDQRFRQQPQRPAGAARRGA